jgi:hypothetical protein
LLLSHAAFGCPSVRCSTVVQQVSAKIANAAASHAAMSKDARIPFPWGSVAQTPAPSVISTQTRLFPPPRFACLAASSQVERSPAYLQVRWGTTRRDRWPCGLPGWLIGGYTFPLPASLDRRPRNQVCLEGGQQLTRRKAERLDIVADRHAGPASKQPAAT